MSVEANDPKQGAFGWPEAAALAAGFLAGGILAFGVRFLGVLPGLGDAMARRTLVLSGMGMLGVTVYGVAAWTGREETGGRRAAVYRLVAYLASILGGGVTGVVVYLAVKAAIAGAVIGVGTPQIRFSAALVIAFLGGLLLGPMARGLICASRAVSRRDGSSESSR